MTMARSPLLSPEPISAPTGPPSSDFLLSPWRKERESVTTVSTKQVALGRPERKEFFDLLDVTAVFVSIASLLAATLVVHPGVGIAWRIGFQAQIIIIGLMLSVMTLCMRRILPTLFLLIEARFGASSLQDYEAILRGTVTLYHTNLFWRMVLFLMIILPLGLSVAYKQFIGGTSEHLVTHAIPSMYGAASLTAGNSSAEKNPLFYALNATAPFEIAAAREADLPSAAELPVPYGYNVLLLNDTSDNTSVALLDVPAPDYIQSIQSNLSDGETWTISATVNATVTSLNTTFTQWRTDNATWNASFAEGWAWNAQLSSWNLYNAFRFGILAGLNEDETSQYCFAGIYKPPSDDQDYDVTSYYSTDEDAEIFRKIATLFTTIRQRCFGMWEIAEGSVRLLGGSCSPQDLQQKLFQNSTPFWLDAGPVLVHALTDYAPTGKRNDSKWTTAAYAVNIAAMEWSRMIWMNSSFDPELHEAYYPANNETIVSKMATLNTGGLLYIILAIQPLLTIFGFIVATYFYHIPISKGFGLISILAGMDRETQGMLNGAALSGRLHRPVTMHIEVDDIGEAPEIRYSLGVRARKQTATLHRKVYR